VFVKILSGKKGLYRKKVKLKISKKQKFPFEHAKTSKSPLTFQYFLKEKKNKVHF
jgi:hypothetical protein